MVIIIENSQIINSCATRANEFSPMEYINESVLAARVRFQHEQSGSDCDTSRGAASFRHGWHFRSVREGLLVTGQEEEIRDESAQENAQSSFQ